MEIQMNAGNFTPEQLNAANQAAEAQAFQNEMESGIMQIMTAAYGPDPIPKIDALSNLVARQLAIVVFSIETSEQRKDAMNTWQQNLRERVKQNLAILIAAKAAAKNAQTSTLIVPGD